MNLLYKNNTECYSNNIVDDGTVHHNMTYYTKEEVKWNVLEQIYATRSISVHVLNTQMSQGTVL